MNSDAPNVVTAKPEDLIDPLDQIAKVSVDEMIKIENVSYNLKIGLDNDNQKIIFYLENKSIITDEFYYCGLNFENFLSLGKYFKICSNIEEVLSGIISIHQQINESKNGFSIELDFKSNKDFCFIKYSCLMYIGSEIFEINLKKIDKDKDCVIKDLKEKINSYECNWLNIDYKEDYQKLILDTFKKIHHEMNEIGKKIIDNANANNYLKLKFIGVRDLNTYINSLLNNNSNFTFSWKAGENCTLCNFNRRINKTGGNNFNCTVIGDKILIKNSINEWKIRIINSRTPMDGISIGVGPSDLNIKDSDCFSGWSLYCNGLHPGLYLRSKKKIKYGQGMKSGDIIGVKMNTILNELSFSLNGEDLGVACRDIPTDIDLVPVVFMYYEEDSVELLKK